MHKKGISRREFVKASAILAASAPLAPAMAPALAATAFTPTPGLETFKDRGITLSWLGGKTPESVHGVTWGVPWPRGKYKRNTSFALNTKDGQQLPVQSWPLAYWPDGSLKWTAHAASEKLPAAADLQLVPGSAAALPVKPLKITDNPAFIEIDTGIITCRINKTGKLLVPFIVRDGKRVFTDGKLVLQCQDAADPEDTGTVTTTLAEGLTERVSLEHPGSLRACVKIEGKHQRSEREPWLPFVVRMYFYSGTDAIRVIHTIVYDGDEYKDFIKGLGIRFSVPLTSPLHDRHVRFSGEGEGLFAEAVRGLTGLRRDPGKEVIAAQLAGKATTPLSTFPENVAKPIGYIPAFGDYTLSQLSPDSFGIRKRTAKGFGWLQAAYGSRSQGLGYIGQPSSGIAFGIRNFWQSHPAQLDIRNASTENAEVTMWLWAPDTAAMDLRFYHDGMGQDTYEKQRDGLDITYEDYEPGFGSPKGIARSSELTIWVLPGTPSSEKFLEFSRALSDPALLVCSPDYMKSVEIFGGAWSVPDRSKPAKAAIEDQLALYFDFYRNQVDQRKWYGFWNFGDVMHSYDHDRHVWKYDIGGFAWDNSELSTDLWLWYYFLRTGRADVFRMAEAMTRHTGEVDVHHLGPFAPLGSRHNVLHWGDSAKQLRISTAANRRFLYYLTADERTGDLLKEQVDAVKKLADIRPNRKVPGALALSISEGEAQVSFGTDWGAIAAAWLTEWERTGDTAIKNKLLNSMQGIADQPHGFLSGSSVLNTDTGKFRINKDTKPYAHHLNAVFGLSEICFELLVLVDNKAFRNAWLLYCEYYNATEEQQISRFGQSLGKLNLKQSHSRLTAFVAEQKNDQRLGKRAWNEFFTESGGITRDNKPVIHVVRGPVVLYKVDEIPGISTNGVAQWSLAAMQCLAFGGRWLE